MRTLCLSHIVVSFVVMYRCYWLVHRTCESNVTVLQFLTLDSSLPVFVDDMTFASMSLPAIKQAIADLSTHFKLRDLEPMTELLGIEIDRNHTTRSLTISQPQYCAEMLSRYGMGDSKPVSTPMTPGLCLSREQSPRTADERAFMRSVDYGWRRNWLSAVSLLHNSS
jgi:hypothetical protein